MKTFIAITSLFILSSCARVRHDKRPDVVELHSTRDLGIKRDNRFGNSYSEFSCFDNVKTGRVFTTYASDIREVLGFLYEMETAYDLTYTIYNDQIVVVNKAQVISRPPEVQFEIAYCYYESRRHRYLHFSEPSLLYMSVRYK